MKAWVNGEERPIRDGMTLRDLLDELSAPAAGIAVAKNERVVRRDALASETISHGDRIEIIRAVAGG